jgi:UDP-2,4-diacetamido-2,4,6-trideoxy-beta-L-altropyranose hydrolase
MLSVAIRCDVSISIGSGHLMRCLTLAKALRDRGCTISFICGEHQSNLLYSIENFGFKLYKLPRSIVVDKKLKHSEWLGATQEYDAKQTISALKLIGVVDWLIVDHYSLDEEWESIIKNYVRSVLVIDDLADRKHNCEVLLDQNYYIDMHARYQELVPGNCKKLLGPEFSLLRPSFLQARHLLENKSRENFKIFIFFGSVDPSNETIKALKSIKLINIKDIEVDVVVGADNPNKLMVKNLCDQMPNANFYSYVENIENLIVNSDLAIGASGTSIWERCCLGVPALVWSIADNQNEIARGAHQLGVVISLGSFVSVTIQKIIISLRELILDDVLRENMSRKSLETVDGKGLERVTAALLPKLKLSIVSDRNSWINGYIAELVDGWRSLGHTVEWVHDVKFAPNGDISFFLGCSQIADKNILFRNTHNLVVHESALPRGRGWSPLTWQIIEGKREIPITLFEASDILDSGKIYLTDVLEYDGSELIDKLRYSQAQKTIFMCRKFVNQYPEIILRAHNQEGEASYYAHRKKEDSELDVDKSLKEQFNLLRVVDNKNYPAFFKLYGKKYVIKIEEENELFNSKQ